MEELKSLLRNCAFEVIAVHACTKAIRGDIRLPSPIEMDSREFTLVAKVAQNWGVMVKTQELREKEKQINLMTQNPEN